jgi:hypothetical protein
MHNGRKYIETGRPLTPPLAKPAFPAAKPKGKQTKRFRKDMTPEQIQAAKEAEKATFLAKFDLMRNEDAAWFMKVGIGRLIWLCERMTVRFANKPPALYWECVLILLCQILNIKAQMPPEQMKQIVSFGRARIRAKREGATNEQLNQAYPSQLGALTK